MCCVAAKVKNAFTSANCDTRGGETRVRVGEWASSIWEVAKVGSAYVEQARIVRRLWRCRRVGREHGIAGGLDGEARGAFGEQELAVIPPGVSTMSRAPD